MASLATDCVTPAQYGKQDFTSALVEISLPLSPFPLMVHHDARNLFLGDLHNIRDCALGIILDIGERGRIMSHEAVL